MNRKTFIAVPSHDGKVHGDLISSVMDAAISGESIGFAHQPFSLLARNFNDLLCRAINTGGYTHFLLLHADIIPMPGWLPKLHQIMEEKQCDMLSVVSPIKTAKGNTSTAIQTGAINNRTEKFACKRLNMKEIADLPETFEDPGLLVNSGCLLLDLRAPWIGKVWFEIMDDVVKTEDGKYKTKGISEDWVFSMRARAAGAKIFATRAVKIYHVGTHAFTNDPKDWA